MDSSPLMYYNPIASLTSARTEEAASRALLAPASAIPLTRLKSLRQRVRLSHIVSNFSTNALFSHRLHSIHPMPAVLHPTSTCLMISWGELFRCSDKATHEFGTLSLLDVLLL